MDETTRTRRTAQEYVDRTERRDWDGLRVLLADDVVYEMPQTRERIHGRATFLRFNQEYPGDWHLLARRIVADGRYAAAWLDARVGDEAMTACVWLELSEDGLISRVTDYWPEPYEPRADRGYPVERVESGAEKSPDAQGPRVLVWAQGPTAAATLVKPH